MSGVMTSECAADNTVLLISLLLRSNPACFDVAAVHSMSWLAMKRIVMAPACCALYANTCNHKHAYRSVLRPKAGPCSSLMSQAP